jgi:electron transfer flavoprotein beta subunit
MKIIICVKQVEFTYARTGRDPVKNYIAPEDNVFRINPWDESALDIALKLKEKDSSIKVIVLTLGPVIAEKELRRCIAIGADRIYRIDTEAEYDSWAKSILLAEGIKVLNSDLVFCGKESVDKQNGQVGAFIAHHLGLPFVSGVTQFSIGEEGKAKAIRHAGKGAREEIECPLPAVFSVSRESIEARLPTCEQKQKALTSPFKILDIDLNKAKRNIMSDGLYPPRPRPKKVITPDSSMPAFDRINQLLSGSNIEKKGAMLTGDPESQVEEILSYLKENGFLPAEDSSCDK